MRLIDVDFVCDHIEKEIKDIVIPRCPYAKRKDSEYDIGYNNGLTMAKAIAMKAPTIEAEPVRHGRWNDGDPYCPICRKDKFRGLDADIWADWKPDYCPNCGAKMRGEADE